MPPPQKRPRQSPNAKIGLLQAEVDSLRAELEHLQLGTEAAQKLQRSSVTPCSTPRSASVPSQLPLVTASPGTALRAEVAIMRPSLLEDPLLNVLYPGWPADLPTPILTFRLVEIYFSRPGIHTGMINQSKFRTRLTLPPTHPNFPHSSLIHVICAIAATTVPETFFASESRYWQHHASPSEYHVRRCKLAISRNSHINDHAFQTAQTTALLAHYFYSQNRFIEQWICVGQGSRLAVLGLTHLRSAFEPPSSQLGVEPISLLPGTADQDELYERAMTFWMLFLADRFASAVNNWPCSINEADVTTVIPTEGTPYPLGESIFSSVNSPRNSHFFTSHPPEFCGPLQLLLKAVVLFGRVVTFHRRAPESATAKRCKDANSFLRAFRESDLFQRLAMDIQNFLSSIPPHYRFQHYVINPLPDNLAAPCLALVSGLAHSANILLQEPCVLSLDEADESMRSSLASAHAILSDLYICFVWRSAGRVLIRQIAIKQFKGETDDLDSLREHVATIVTACRALDIPYGENCIGQLMLLLIDPRRALPIPILLQAKARDPSFDMNYFSESVVPPPLQQTAQPDTSRSSPRVDGLASSLNEPRYALKMDGLAGVLNAQVSARITSV
ncbi:fungal specific transcription factor domain-containing protein [Rhodotorula paludigena]|uniref:fungal specific transcription factor domain-containing protein n=1 Tax=Rhodotorula paludigena TaxID=86838 RepID=UPI0031822411